MFDKDCDAASYNDYAEHYDKYIKHLSNPLALHICSLAQLKHGDNVLDVGTGSGVAARNACQIVGSEGDALGIDLSEGMIDHAQRSVAQWEGKKPEFCVMDAESLDLPDASFDAVISLCAVCHFPDIAQAINEMHRVLKPGGYLVVSFGYHRPIKPVALGIYIGKRLWEKATSKLRPQITGPSYLTDLAEQLLPPSKQVVDTEWGEHDPQNTLAQLLQTSGFTQVKKSWWGHEVIFDSAHDFWEAQCAIVTKVRKQLMDADPKEALHLKQLFIEKAENVLQRNGKLVYPYSAFFATGLKPK